MNPVRPICAPFFEIGPKSYLYGDELLCLAQIADSASQKYGVDIIFTSPLVEITRVKASAPHLHVFAPHMDPLRPGKGVADTLPEALAAAGAEGVMLNHAEKPLSLSVLCQTIHRAREVGLSTLVCAGSIEEAVLIAGLHPNILVAEPPELIGSGVTSSQEFIQHSMQAIKAIDPKILVLQGAGISCGEDVYRAIFSGADASGSSSGIVKAPDRAAMVDEMIRAVRQAWDDRRTGRCRA